MNCFYFECIYLYGCYFSDVSDINLFTISECIYFMDDGWGTGGGPGLVFIFLARHIVPSKHS